MPPTPLRIGTRSAIFQRYYHLLFEDRIEEIGYTLSALEVSRLFFDEVRFAALRTARRWIEISCLTFLALAVQLLWLTLLDGGDAAPLAIVLPATILPVAGLIYVSAHPAYLLTLRAPDQEMTVRMTRRNGRREELLRRILETIRSHQARHAPPAAP